MAMVRICFVVTLGALIPYYEKGLIIMERYEVYIYIHQYKDKKAIT